MEKTIEILLVATVVLMTAVIVIFMLQGRVGGFNDFLQNQSDDAKCSIGETRYSNAVDCENTEETSEASDIKDSYPQCDTSSWTPQQVC